VASSGSAGAMQTIVGDATADGGKQVITLASSYGDEQFTLLLSSGVVYFQGNVPALEDQIGVSSGSASTWQGRWIAVRAGDGPYNVLEPGITVSQQAQQLGLVPASSSSMSVDGTQVTRLSGSVPPQNGAPAGTGYLDVAVGSDLPVDYVTRISQDGFDLTSTTSFSDWGTAISVSVPGGAVAWSTLGASEPPGGYGSGGAGGGGGSPAPSTPATI
jgi:hypothetical protein